MKEEQITTNKKAEHYDGFHWPCGCTMKTPHSHLVYGHACPCEAGDTKLEIKLPSHPLTL